MHKGRTGCVVDWITIDPTYTSRIIVPVACFKKISSLRRAGFSIFKTVSVKALGEGSALSWINVFLLAVLGLCRTIHAQIILNFLDCFVNLIRHFWGCVQGLQTLEPFMEVWRLESDLNETRK